MISSLSWLWPSRGHNKFQSYIVLDAIRPMRPLMCVVASLSWNFSQLIFKYFYDTMKTHRTSCQNMKEDLEEKPGGTTYYTLMWMPRITHSGWRRHRPDHVVTLIRKPYGVKTKPRVRLGNHIFVVSWVGLTSKQTRNCFSLTLTITKTLILFLTIVFKSFNLKVKFWENELSYFVRIACIATNYCVIKLAIPILGLWPAIPCKHFDSIFMRV